jgi:hypothetical protein
MDCYLGIIYLPVPRLLAVERERKIRLQLQNFNGL